MLFLPSPILQAVRTHEYTFFRKLPPMTQLMTAAEPDDRLRSKKAPRHWLPLKTPRLRSSDDILYVCVEATGKRHDKERHGMSRNRQASLDPR